MLRGAVLMGQVSNASPLDDPEFSSPLTLKEKADYFVVTCYFKYSTVFN